MKRYVAGALVSLATAAMAQQIEKKLEDQCFEKIKPVLAMSKGIKVKEVQTHRLGRLRSVGEDKRGWITTFTFMPRLPKGFVHIYNLSCVYDSKTLAMVRDDYSEYLAQQAKDKARDAGLADQKRIAEVKAKRYQ
jgi:hypothetical protein